MLAKIKIKLYFILASNKNLLFLLEFKIKNNINTSLLTDVKNYRASLGVPGTSYNVSFNSIKKSHEQNSKH